MSDRLMIAPFALAILYLCVTRMSACAETTHDLHEQTTQTCIVTRAAVLSECVKNHALNACVNMYQSLPCDLDRMASAGDGEYLRQHLAQRKTMAKDPLLDAGTTEFEQLDRAEFHTDAP